MLQVRNLTLETHCARLPFSTGEDKHAAVNCKAGIDDSEIRAGVLHASGRPFSAYSFRPVKEYVAVGGRNPRVLGVWRERSQIVNLVFDNLILHLFHFPDPTGLRLFFPGHPFSRPSAAPFPSQARIFSPPGEAEALMSTAFVPLRFLIISTWSLPSWGSIPAPGRRSSWGPGLCRCGVHERSGRGRHGSTSFRGSDA